MKGVAFLFLFFFCSVSKYATCFVLTSCAHMDRTRASKTGERKQGCKVKGSFNTTKMKIPQMKTNVILFHCFSCINKSKKTSLVNK